MAEHHAGAGADHDRHARDHSEGRKQAAPDAPFRQAKALEPGFADAESKRHYLPLNPKVKVRRQYRGARLTSRENRMDLQDFCPAKTKGPAGCRPFRQVMSSISMRSVRDQYLATTGPPKLKR